MGRYKTRYRLWAAAALGVWVVYLTIDHFANSGYGIVYHADDLIGALCEGQEIKALVPNARAFFVVPFLQSVAIAFVLGWLVHALVGMLGVRLGRGLDPTMVADYDDKPRSPAE
jgi:hypothetical protein